VVEIISLTYAKFSCSLFMLDSCFLHVMILCTIQGSPNVHFFLSNFFAFEDSYERVFFCKMVKLTNSLVEPRT
jgi:hypothetical protein